MTLLLAGFHVGYGAATGEKDQTTLATNTPALLTAPMDEAWLGRVSRSVRSAPLRREILGATISSGDYLLLKRHAQFA